MAEFHPFGETRRRCLGNREVTCSILALAPSIELLRSIPIEYLEDSKSSNCLHNTAVAMLSTSRGAALRAISSSPSISIPAFLVPAFQSSARAFSATTSTQSQIGRAPLSIPPEVNFTVTYPTAPKNARPSPEQLRPTVKVEGPLGSLSMTIPPFVHIEHDTVTKKAFVTVEDREVRKQREMWGMI